MKITKAIRVNIRKQGSPGEFIAISGASTTEVVEYLKEVLRPHVDPFAEGRVTSISVREYTKDSPVLTFSFRGIDPAEVKVILCDAIAHEKAA